MELTNGNKIINYKFEFIKIPDKFKFDASIKAIIFSIVVLTIAVVLATHI